MFLKYIEIFIFFKDCYLFWLKSIDSFGDTKTPVMVIGTHADKISENVSLNKLNHKILNVYL